MIQLILFTKLYSDTIFFNLKNKKSKVVRSYLTLETLNAEVNTKFGHQ